MNRRHGLILYGAFFGAAIIMTAILGATFELGRAAGIQRSQGVETRVASYATLTSTPSTTATITETSSPSATTRPTETSTSTPTNTATATNTPTPLPPTEIPKPIVTAAPTVAPRPVGQSVCSSGPVGRTAVIPSRATVWQDFHMVAAGYIRGWVTISGYDETLQVSVMENGITREQWSFRGSGYFLYQAPATDTYRVIYENPSYLASKNLRYDWATCSPGYLGA